MLYQYQPFYASTSRTGSASAFAWIVNAGARVPVRPSSVLDKNNAFRYFINVMAEAVNFPAAFRRTLKCPWP
jgi:hypothetical protein